MSKEARILMYEYRIQLLSSRDRENRYVVNKLIRKVRNLKGE